MLSEILTHSMIRLTDLLGKKRERHSVNVAVLFGEDSTEILYLQSDSI